ncbi:hypothetical protein HK105_203608 [Polyrhizophydium stewartii]|uniref:RING-type domain-containing protein n=1 Tax=Polyrhizophydium stewartii TaxID=2732419 RepID=A0ABR4NBI1_9FUNG
MRSAILWTLAACVAGVLAQAAGSPNAAGAGGVQPNPPPPSAAGVGGSNPSAFDRDGRPIANAANGGIDINNRPSIHTGHQPTRQLPSLDEVIRREERRLARPLTPEEKAELAKTLAFLKEHQGHEAQHAEMAMILLGSLIGSQIAIMAWKRYHAQSFNMATLLGLWIVPMGIGFNAGNYRFVFVWTLFSIANTYIVKLALESPMQSSTPKIVYRWYRWVYNIAYIFGIIGYSITMVAVFHIPALFRITDIEGEAVVFETGVIMLFYGLYFGTLGRDFVDRLSDRMALTMGYYSRTGFPRKHLRDHMCAICGESTAKTIEPTHTLNCNHIYHEQCIRGWTIIGKKDVCPYCKEKVDLNAFKKNPWDTTQQMYLALLDALRYLLVWNPIVFIVVHVLFNVFGLK